MDNVQAFYFAKLEAALEYALHGDIDLCVDICFDLRLKSDLSLYIRALVNLTLTDLTRVEDHPDKLKWAEEANRLALELIEESQTRSSASWRVEYARLGRETGAKLEKVRTEVEKYKLVWDEYQKALADLQTDTTPSEEMAKLNLEEGIKEGTGTSDEALEPWDVEGSFSTRVPEPIMATESDSDINSPALPSHSSDDPKEKQQGAQRQLPTPATHEL